MKNLNYRVVIQDLNGLPEVLHEGLSEAEARRLCAANKHRLRDAWVETRDKKGFWFFSREEWNQK